MQPSLLLLRCERCGDAAFSAPRSSRRCVCMGRINPLAPTAATSQFSTGVPGFDAVLGGGMRSGSIVLLVGLPGSGKTILAQQIAYHRAAAGDRVLILLVLSETQDKLIAHGRELAFFD